MKAKFEGVNLLDAAIYAPGMKPREFLTYYATQFRTVEIDSTFYGTPSPTTVAGWHERTPQDFTFAVKVPQVITDERVLVDYTFSLDAASKTL